jgi:steroid delta-isomerase-like uncharacterized protein
MTESKQMIIERLFEGWNNNDAEAVLSLYDEAFIREDLANQKTYSCEDLRKTVIAYHRAFPNLHLDVEKLIEKEDQVVVCWKASGDHKGKIRNIPATGKHVVFRGVSVLQITNDKITRAWYIWDEAAMLRQMGMLTELRQAI